MARSKTNPSTSVTFRMPDGVLKEIDKLAQDKFHDRTAEINSACRHWVLIGGDSENERNTQEEIASLTEQIQLLEKQIEAMMQKMELEKKPLLKIIENHEHTIKCLLATLPRDSTVEINSE